MILLGGYLIFGSDPGIVSIGGAIAALSGMSVYTSLNLQQPQDKEKEKQLPKINSPSLKPKANSDDSTDSDVKITPIVV